MRTNDALNVGESTALLHAIFPGYPDLRGMKPAPEVDGFLLDLRSQSLPCIDQKSLSLRLTTVTIVKARTVRKRGCNFALELKAE
jgi:hypothetical protein